MKQIFHIDTNAIYERANELREFGDSGDMTAEQWYNWNISRTHFSSGEMEQAVAEALHIPHPASNGFGISSIDRQSVIIADLEDQGVCDLQDPDDAHLIEPVKAFREWLYGWSSDALNRVMDTQEAAAIWGYETQDSVKRLCNQGLIKCRKMANGTWIIDRNQPSPRQKGY